MSLILIDTSVWIEFFSPRPKMALSQLEILKEKIVDDEIAIIEPIRVELLSGGISTEKRREVDRLIGELKKLDLNWNDKTTWDRIVGYSDLARSHKISTPGVVDRMILLAAKLGTARLWSFDRTLQKLALCDQIELV